MRYTFAKQPGAQRHQILKAAQDLLDLDLKFTHLVDAAITSHDLTEKESIVELHADRGRKPYRLTRMQSQTLTFKALEHAGDTSLCSIGFGCGELNSRRRGMVG